MIPSNVCEQIIAIVVQYNKEAEDEITRGTNWNRTKGNVPRPFMPEVDNIKATAYGKISDLLLNEGLITVTLTLPYFYYFVPGFRFTVTFYVRYV